MFLTNILLKPKAKTILVVAKSMVSGHRRFQIRERLSDKAEFMAFDPFVQQTVMYKEHKKIRSLK